MNRDQKAAVIDEIAANINASHAIFAVDYRGISVEQAGALRERLRDADATLRVVKNSLTERAADKAGAESLKDFLSGPTALTFVRGDGALAAKSLADFARTTQLLAFKGGVMDGAVLSPAEITSISRLPSRDVLYGQLVGLVATPISGLARTLNALIGGLAIQLGGILGQREAAGEVVPPSPAAAETSAEEETPAAVETSAAEEPSAAAETPAAEETPAPEEAPDAAQTPAAADSMTAAEEPPDASAETLEEEPSAQADATTPQDAPSEEPSAQADATTPDADDEKENQ